MSAEEKNDISEDLEQKDDEQSVPEESEDEAGKTEELKAALAEAKDKYIRLYADFENFKKISARNREELLKYANEDLMTAILSVIDHLELALQHAAEDTASNPLAEGVQLTLKELLTVLEKFGLTVIEALGKPFDPSVHHAMSQIESADAEENTVLKEFRRGYMYKERVLRASMVGVSVKPSGPEKEDKAGRNK